MSIETSAADAAQFESGYNLEPTETPEPAAPEAKPETAAPVDPLKDVMARFEKFEATQNTLAGHIGGLTRTQKELQTALAAANAATRTVSDAPTQAQVKTAMTDPAEWGALKRGYPEWATATEKFMDAKLATLPAPQALDPAAIEKIVSERTAQVREEVIDSRLDEIVDGDWRKEVGTPEFDKWINAQAPEIKALSESAKITDAARMMRLYQASKQAAPAPKPAVKAEPSPEVSTRQKRLAAAVAPRGAGGHASTSSELDEFNAGYSG